MQRESTFLRYTVDTDALQIVARVSVLTCHKRFVPGGEKPIATSLNAISFEGLSAPQGKPRNRGNSLLVEKAVSPLHQLLGGLTGL